MATLDEARRTKKRQRNFAGRPRKVISGKPVAKVRPVAHRSEVLMDDQIDMVESLQNQLQQAMEYFVAARSKADVVFWGKQVDDLKAESEELVLILKVVGKLNSELVHAKIAVKETMRSGGDVPSARKKVIWLEDRINQLLGRYRKESQSARTEKSNRSLEDVPQVSAKPIATVSPLKPEKSILKQPSASSRKGHTQGKEDDIQKISNGGRDSRGGGDATSKQVFNNFEEKTEAAAHEDLSQVKKEEKSLVLTETGDNRDVSSQAGPSASVQLKEETEATLNGDNIVDDRDLADIYWDSPHHKFDFSDQFDAITRENPLSYHNLGLAVTSSFIEPAPETASELPWRQMEHSDLLDIHHWKLKPLRPMTAKEYEFKLALEKVSNRIHEIWEKMEDAAIKSVEYNPSPDGSGRGSKLMSNGGSRVGTAVTNVSRAASSLLPVEEKANHSRPSTSKTKSAGGSRQRPSTRVETLPPVESRATTPHPLHLKYYPKPIPAPEVLPLTRTNPEKKYPRISSDWNDTPPEEMEGTVRLVNQMNVAKETNLIIYKKHNKSRSNSQPKQITKPFTLESSPKKCSPPGSAKMNLAAVNLASLIGAKCKSGVRRLDKEGPKWQRIMVMLAKLESDRVEERRDTARNFGVLDCCEKQIIAALMKRLEDDDDSRVRYESAKSVISLGYWSALAVAELVRYLRNGSHAAKSDVVTTMINARNTHLVNKNLPIVRELISVLRRLCASPAGDDLGYDCAVCLGRLCVPDKVAKQKLMGSLSSNDTHVTARSLEILVRQLQASDSDVVKIIIHQLEKSSVWKYRAAAARLLVFLGLDCFPNEEEMNSIFGILQRRLHDDPSREVRAEVAATLSALGMRDWIVDQVEKDLESEDDDCRAQAVISAGVLGMKSDKIIRMLLEMLELDSCEYVRLHVARTLVTLEATQVKVMRALKDRERAGGPLAREAAKALKALTAIQASRNTGRSPSPPSPLGIRKTRSAATTSSSISSPLLKKMATAHPPDNKLVKTL